MVVGEFTQETDLLIVGGGPGGYSAAFRAAELEISTTIVDTRDALGGVCLHEGCVPSKTLLSATESVRVADQAAQMGITFGQPTVDVDTMRTWVQKSVAQLVRGLEGVRKKHGVQFISGQARFEDPKNVSIPGSDTPRIKFRRAIIAPGSKPIEHPEFPFEDERIMRPGESLSLARVPRRLLVLGGGYTPIELASIYTTLGSEVALVTLEDSLVPGADPDLLRPLERRLKETLAAVVVGTEITKVSLDDDWIRVTLARPEGFEPCEFDGVIVAVGQRANVDELCLENIDVRLNENGFINVDQQMRTSNQRIMAVGDVTGRPLLADKAVHQGKVAAEVIAGWGSVYEPRAVPKVVFTDPQVAWCGLTETQAREEGISFEAKKIPWGASGRAVGMGRTDGLTKIIYDPDTKLVLGVGIAGPHASEMISEGCLAIEMGAELGDLAGTIHPHPTMSELMSSLAAEFE